MSNQAYDGNANKQKVVWTVDGTTTTVTLDPEPVTEDGVYITAKDALTAMPSLAMHAPKVVTWVKATLDVYDQYLEALALSPTSPRVYHEFMIVNSAKFMEAVEKNGHFMSIRARSPSEWGGVVGPWTFLMPFTNEYIRGVIRRRVNTYSQFPAREKHEQRIRLTWIAADPIQLAEAQTRFEGLQRAGFQAYYMIVGKSWIRLDEFVPELEEVVFQKRHRTQNCAPKILSPQQSLLHEVEKLRRSKEKLAAWKAKEMGFQITEIQSQGLQGLKLSVQ